MSEKDGIEIENIEETTTENNEKEVVVEKVSVEEIGDDVLESIDEELNLEKKDNIKVEDIDNNPSIFKKIISSLLDQAILVGVSAILLLVFDFLIRFIGFMVGEPTPVLMIIYGILNVIYLPIFEKGNRRSIGKRILAIKY